MPIAATAIGRNGQLLGLRVALFAHAQPPASNGLHGKCRGVMVSAHTYPSLISSNVVNPIRIGATEFLVNEIVNLYLVRLTAGEPLLPGILKGADQFLFLRIHRYHWLVGLQGRRHCRVDMLELGVAIRTLIALQHFAVGLQAVVLTFEKFAHHHVAHLMTFSVYFIG